MYEIFRQTSPLAKEGFNDAAMQLSKQALIARLGQGVDRLEQLGLLPSPREPRTAREILSWKI